ncbi:hypothetical protein C0J50_23537 [Silurus asotus]|uniref:Galectin n=1 Tax=Silurus asotus TaxID=30991 RepID=A0AAD5FIJ5_SILAS|nr:hypothetical protein C0J50_23537 [Silurus asotus]
MLCWFTLPALRLSVAALVCFSVRSSAEMQLICSSNSLSIWGEYEGPVHYFQIRMGSCSNGMNILNMNYTLITKFTLVRVGYQIRSYYRDQLWVEFFQAPVPCSDLKFCNIVKGETLTETLSVPVKSYYAFEGEYLFHAKLNIIDDLEREIHINIRIVLHVRNVDEFTVVQVGWHMSIVYKNNTWVEETRALSPCEDFRICDVIKGETIHETFLVSIKPYLIPDGEYHLLLTVNIIDEFNMELTLRGKLTVHARKDILKIHMRQWDPQPSDAFLEELADKCVVVQSSSACVCV